MTGAVFFETLRRTWRQTLLWGLGLAAMALLIVLILPAMDAMDLAGMLNSLPKPILAAVGLGADMEFALTPEGLIAIGFFGKFALFFIAYPVVMGLRVTASEESDGVMDILLTLPLPRWQVVLEKFAAYLLSIVLLAAIIFGAMWLGTRFVDLFLNMERLLESVVNLLPTLTFVLAFTTFIGAALRRRQAALVTAFVLVSYMLDTIGTTAQGSAAENLRLVSFFSYYNPSGVMQFGLSWLTVAGLLALSALLVGGAVWAFQRRDVGV